MKVAKMDNGLAVALPDAVVEGLSLKPGDDIEVDIKGDSSQKAIEIGRRSSPESIEAMISRMRGARRPLPQGYKFNRAEANGFDEE